jgi:hypothetical protein
MRSRAENKFPLLVTKRLTLRAPTAKDVTAFRAILSIPDVTRFSNWPDNPTQAQCERFVRWMAKLYASGNGSAWIIEDRGSKTLAGAIRYNSVQKKWKCGQIGYELGQRPDDRGRRRCSDIWSSGSRAQSHRGLDAPRQPGLRPRIRKNGISIRRDAAAKSVVQGCVPRLPNVRTDRRRSLKPGSRRI